MEREAGSTPAIVEHIEYQKSSSTNTIELQAGLLQDRVCTIENLPARSTIEDIVRKDLQYTYKKLSFVPEESLSQATQERTMNYIMQTSETDPTKVHFFDESSIKTNDREPYLWSL